MSDDVKKWSRHELEKLSIPELESLLQQDFMAINKDQLNVIYVTTIMEVIQKKEKQMPDYKPIDVDQAWDEFRTHYNTSEGRATNLYCEDEHAEDTCFISRVPRSHKFKRQAVIAAMIFICFIAMYTIPVHGYESFFQMIGHWTAERFNFKDPLESDNNDTMNDQVNNEFNSLHDALSHYDIFDAVIPQYIPNGFELQEIWIKEYPELGDIEFSAPYINGKENIIITIYHHSGNFVKNYEKNNKSVDLYRVKNVEHYIFNNNKNVTAAWYMNSLECSISTTLSVSELEKIIDSIYKE